MSEPVLTVQEVLGMVKRLMSLPFPQICRHSVALDLLSALESKGWNPPAKLCKAICQADDCEALKEIENLSTK